MTASQLAWQRLWLRLSRCHWHALRVLQMQGATSRAYTFWWRSCRTALRGRGSIRTLTQIGKLLYLLVEVISHKDARRGSGGVPGPLCGPRHKEGLAGHQGRLLLYAGVAVWDLHVATRMLSPRLDRIVQQGLTVPSLDGW